LLEVTAVNISGFPSEIEPKRGHLHHERVVDQVQNGVEFQINHTDANNGHRHLAEDGSRIDVICFYTRKALCYEANQPITCNLDQFRYLMDGKCALAVSETVC
jgi:hypothetical protein